LILTLWKVPKLLSYSHLTMGGRETYLSLNTSFERTKGGMKLLKGGK